MVSTNSSCSDLTQLSYETLNYCPKERTFVFVDCDWRWAVIRYKYRLNMKFSPPNCVQCKLFEKCFFCNMNFWLKLKLPPLIFRNRFSVQTIEIFTHSIRCEWVKTRCLPYIWISTQFTRSYPSDYFFEFLLMKFCFFLAHQYTAFVYAQLH